ncbi:MAG TPA: DNA methyltransferase [Brevefilum sp.]|nr:DNA methyltransferase [Brevefilum sp.]HOR18802.1 DNA methyltransferase [Brevefilum sp.]HPL68702.1 DNA methyltransferase [Brevefilum sp.]
MTNYNPALPLNQVLVGDCCVILPTLPENSVDLIFADPPYNLQLEGELWRPDHSRVDPVDDDWDQFESFAQYDNFTHEWLSACRRVLKPTGTLWVIGSYHNIYRVGAILQNLDFWILNDVVWVKTNPMPNFQGMRFTNAHETLLWSQKDKRQKYTFNYRAMKALNDDLQMRSDWEIPICTGPERQKGPDGEKAHSTQKPEALLYRVISASSNPGDVVLDPFFGTGTTGAVARQLHRQFIGIEVDPFYAQLATQRIGAIAPQPFNSQLFETPNPRRERRIPFGSLVEYGLLEPGQTLYFTGQNETTARVLADGHLNCDGKRGSIHQTARWIRNGPANGWQLWYYLNPETGQREPIDILRNRLRNAG